MLVNGTHVRHIMWLRHKKWRLWEDIEMHNVSGLLQRRSSVWNMGVYSLSGRTSYRKILWSLETARLGVIMIVSLWNLTSISAALLPRCLSNFTAIANVSTRISQLRDFTRSCSKTTVRLVNRGAGDNRTVAKTIPPRDQTPMTEQHRCSRVSRSPC